MPTLNGYSFDISRASTGWVRWRNDKPIKSGTINLPPGGLGEQGILFSEQLTWLLGDPAGIPTHWVAFEDARAVSKQHGMVLFGLTMLLHMHCRAHDISILGFGQTTVKKALTGRGGATKHEMVGEAQKRWPDLAIISDDEADALGVGLAFLATQSG